MATAAREIKDPRDGVIRDVADCSFRSAARLSDAYVALGSALAALDVAKGVG